MSYSEVFGGGVLGASAETYDEITFGADVQLNWPIEQQIAGEDTVTDILDLIATAVSLNVDMPDARQVSTGIQATFTNQGANSFTIRDNVGGTIIAIAPGEAWIAYLTDNTTQGGTWRTFQLGATVSVSNAGALAGAGLKAIAATLNQRIEVDTEPATPVNVVDADRAQLKNYTGGVGILNLPTPATVGADWWMLLRNSGSGDLTVTPPAGLIDGSATADFSPGESAIIITDGVDFFTIGFSTANSSAFDFISVAVPGSGDFALSGAQLNRISYRFTGVLTGDRKVVVPDTVQQYWVDNQTTGAFALTVGTAAQVTSPEIPQGERAILYSDGSNVVNATTSSVTFPISVAQGGTGANTAPGALVNLAAVPNTRALNAGVGISGTGLGDLSADRTINAQAANEGAAGVVEIATQAEVATGTDDTRTVTPLKLRNAVGTQGQGAGLPNEFGFENQGGFITVPGFEFDLVNGGQYSLQAEIDVDVATSGFEVQLAFSANQAAGGFVWTVDHVGGGQVRSDYFTFNSDALLVTVAAGGAQGRTLKISAGIGPTADGTVSVQVRQVAADANNADVNAGSWATMTRTA